MKETLKTIKQILIGWVNLIKSKVNLISPGLEKIVDYRRTIIKNYCKCTKYYLGFIPYLSCCGCIRDAKIYCEECKCKEGRW